MYLSLVIISDVTVNLIKFLKFNCIYSRDTSEEVIKVSQNLMRSEPRHVDTKKQFVCKKL